MLGYRAHRSMAATTSGTVREGRRRCYGHGKASTSGRDRALNGRAPNTVACRHWHRTRRTSVTRHSTNLARMEVVLFGIFSWSSVTRHDNLFQSPADESKGGLRTVTAPKFASGSVRPDSVDHGPGSVPNPVLLPLIDPLDLGVMRVQHSRLNAGLSVNPGGAPGEQSASRRRSSGVLGRTSDDRKEGR